MTLWRYSMQQPLWIKKWIKNYIDCIPVIFDTNKFVGNLLMGSWPTMSDKERKGISDWKTWYFESVVSDKSEVNTYEEHLHVPSGDGGSYTKVKMKTYFTHHQKRVRYLVFISIFQSPTTFLSSYFLLRPVRKVLTITNRFSSFPTDLSNGRNRPYPWILHPQLQTCLSALAWNKNQPKMRSRWVSSVKWYICRQEVQPAIFFFIFWRLFYFCGAYSARKAIRPNPNLLLLVLINFAKKIQ